MKPKLVLIADSDPRTTIVGGVGTYTYQLAKQLYKKFTITYIAKKQEGKITPSPYEVITATKEIGASNIDFFKGLKKLSRDIKTDKNTIIHAQRPDWLLPFKNHKGLKVVTLHGSHYKNVKSKKGRFWAAIYRILERSGIKYADKVIAVDHETQREYQEWFPTHANKIVYFPVGVDTSLFKPKSRDSSRKKLNISKNQKTFLFVGRFSKEKRIHEMINSLGKGEKLIIVGTGELEQELKKLAKGKDIDFVGSKNQKELVDYYSAADALLIFSTHEGLPTVMLEALSCGLPVLSTPVGEVPRIIKNEKNGFVSENYRKLLDSTLTEEMKKNCILTAKKYDWKSVASNIYKEVYN